MDNMFPSLFKEKVVREVGADKRFDNRAGETVEARVLELIEHVKEHGYVIIPNAFTPSQIQEAREAVERFTGTIRGGPAASQGRNTFEGVRTQRLYGLVNKSRVFDKFALHPDILALNDHFLDPGYLLSLSQSINIGPGEAAQTIHHDDGYATVPRPRRPFSAAIMVAIDNFSATNGGTNIIPKSHTWSSDRTPQRSEAQACTMPSGSIMYYLGTLYHGGGANTSDKARLALTMQYCQPWLRQVENMMLSVEWDKLDEIPPRLVDMLGYKVGLPFVGSVDGISPRAAVARLVEKLKLKGNQHSML